MEVLSSANGFCQIRRSGTEEDRLREISQHSFYRHYEDLNIRCADRTNFSVNKLVLIESSKLLKKIFSGPEFQLLNLFTQDIICPDFDSDALRHVINLVYHGKSSISSYNDRLRNNMMDILEALQIDIVLADKKRTRNKALQEPIEITIDEDNNDFKNLTVEFERFPQSASTEGQKRNKEVKETPGHKSRVPQGPSGAFKPKPVDHPIKETAKHTGPSNRKSFVTPDRLKRPLDNLQSASVTSKSAKSSPTPGCEPETSKPQRQSTPKPHSLRCQYCLKDMPFRITLEMHQRRCKLNLSQTQDQTRKEVATPSGDTSGTISSMKPTKVGREERSFVVKKFSLNESLEANLNRTDEELANDLLEIKEETLRADETEDLFSLIVDRSSSFTSMNDSLSASFTASKNDQTFPAAMRDVKTDNRLNMTAPALLANQASVETPLRLVENWKDHPIPISEIVSGPSQINESKDTAVVKTEPVSGPVAPENESRKLDCPMCYKTQGSPKGMLTHLINFHFKYKPTEKANPSWACLKCNKIVAQKSELVAHAIGCRDRSAPRVDRKPEAKAKPASTSNKTVCNRCGGYSGNLNFKRKRKCGDCGPCKIQKCNTCKFCRKPSLKKPCERKTCLNPIYPKCMCPSKK